MAYDPFTRGPHPVGVSTVELVDATRDRKLVVEVWYPATEAHRGADLAPATRDRYTLLPGFPEPWQLAVRDAARAPGTHPLVVFSHGFAGHRRQSTFYTTHLASHGYVVVAADHTGNTFIDLMTTRGRSPGDIWRTAMADRPPDIRFLIDAAADGRLGIDADPARVGMTGHSFGGWTSVRTVSEEPRLAAVVALAPPIGMPGLHDAIDFAATRVPTLVIAADRDSIVPVAGVERAFADLAAPADLVVLTNTDHLHFCDNPKLVHEQLRAMPIQLVPLAAPLPPFSELAPGAAGHDATCGLGLAHLDAFVRDVADAQAWRATSLVEHLASRDVVATEVRR